MKYKTFPGGANIPHYKGTASGGISAITAGKIVRIALRQHIGAPATALVKPGDLVKKGQLLAQASGLVSSNIHSSVSGKVKKLVDVEILGMSTPCIEIENDGLDEWDENIKQKGTIETLEPQELLEHLKESGIVGMGGAGFPTHVKYMPPKDKVIDLLVINAAECEPFLTTDHRLMLEYTRDVILGVQLLMKILNIKKAVIGVEENKPDAIEMLKKEAKPGITIETLKAKYPQGAEKQLIYATTKRVVPSGALPAEVGVIVNNVATAKAFKDYIYEGRPLISRVLTLAGNSIVAPGNYEVPIGMNISEIVEITGGVKEDLEKVILGGPMMGNATSTIEIPITKTTSGILFFDKKQARLDKTTPCIRCGKCLTVCPMKLQPLYIAKCSEKKEFKKAKDYYAMDCIECGSCSYICPAKRPLVHSIRVAKRKIQEGL